MRRILGLGALGEALTLAIRWSSGLRAVDVNPNLPLLAQLHHSFWAVPLFALAALTRGSAAAAWLVALGGACIVSDLAHHLVVLPILTGSTEWHWP